MRKVMRRGPAQTKSPWGWLEAHSSEINGDPFSTDSHETRPRLCNLRLFSYVEKYKENLLTKTHRLLKPVGKKWYRDLRISIKYFLNSWRCLQYASFNKYGQIYLITIIIYFKILISLGTCIDHIQTLPFCRSDGNCRFWHPRTNDLGYWRVNVLS